MIKMFRDSLHDFKRSYMTYLSFEIIYSFLASLLFIPFLTYLFNRVVMMIGNGQALINNDVYQTGASFKGLAGLFGVAFLAVTVLFVEFGVIILITQKHYFKQPVTVSQAFRKTLRKLPKLLGLGIFPLFVLLLMGFPFLDASTLPPFLDVNVTILSTEVLHGSVLAKLVYTVIFLAILYVYIRWIYALHFIFIEDKSITRAMAASWRLTKKRKFRLVSTIVLWNIGMVALGFLLIMLVSQVTNFIDSKIVGDFIGNYLVSISSYISIVLSLFFVPLNMIMLTHFYYQSLEEDGTFVVDRVTLGKAPILGRFEASIGRLYKRKRAVVVSFAVVVLAGIVLINGFVQSSIVYLPWDVEVAGHRGDGFSAPENTVSSVESGIQKGVDAVEIDVTLTKDDVLVLSHDLDLERLADIPVTIREEDYSDISDIDIGSSFDESFAGETLTTLDDILEITTASDTRVIIDVKAEADEETYAKEIARAVEENDAEDLASVQSFNPTFLELMRDENEEIDLGQILFLYAGNLSSLDVDFYTVRETMLTERFVERAQKQNRRIWVWTVNSERNIKKVLSYDIDGIITDYPERVQQVIGITPAAGEDE